MKLHVKKLHPDAIIPTKTNPTDAGIDLYALEDVSILPGETVKVRTGISLQLQDIPREKLYVNLLWDRSGLGSKGIHRLAGVVDFNYIGEIIVCLTNLNILPVLRDFYNNCLYSFQFGKNVKPSNFIDRYVYQIKKGDRIAQVLVQEIVPVTIEEVSELTATERGANGFGSSGS